MTGEGPSPPGESANEPADRDGASRDRFDAGRGEGAADDAGAFGPAGESLTFTDIADAVMELGRTVTELAADLEDLHATKAAAGPWWNIDALVPADAERLRGTVVAFGDYLKAVYAITALPHRWEDDPALLAELSALYVGWIGAYREPGASTAAPLQWQEALDRAIERIRGYQDRRRQHDSVNPHTRYGAPSGRGGQGVDTAHSLPPLPVAFIPEPATGD